MWPLIDAEFETSNSDGLSECESGEHSAETAVVPTSVRSPGAGENPTDWDAPPTILNGALASESERGYVENYFFLDERIPNALAMPDGAVRDVNSLYDDQQRRLSNAYNGFLVPTGDTNMVTTRAPGPPRL